LKVAAIVPMRHDSERVVGKNYRTFCGEPLYRYVVRSLLACPLLSEVVIDTDSEVIARDAARVFPTVRLLRRPEHLRAGTVPMNDVLLNTVAQCDAELVLQTHSTNPLLRPETIAAALTAYANGSRDGHDSLFSVTRIQSRLWDAAARPINHDTQQLLRTQDLPATYEENSSLYVFTPDLLRRRKNRIGDRPLMFEMSKIEAWDIDEEDDFVIAEALHERLRS
jgi:CMP-N-acetylneuraminic acid synthetase